VPCLPHTLAPKNDASKPLIDDDDELIAPIPQIYPSKNKDHHASTDTNKSLGKKMSFIN
jgi:hypothetical protein